MKKFMFSVCAAIFFAVSLNAQTTKPDTPKTPPPPPPPPPKVETVKFAPPRIVKDDAINISIIKGDTIITATKDNATQKIKMKDWRTRKEYYENKYGKLPAPYTE